MKALLAAFSLIDIISGIIIITTSSSHLLGIILLVKGLMSVIPSFLSGFFFDVLGFIDILGALVLLGIFNFKLLGILLVAKGLYSLLFVFV